MAAHRQTKKREPKAAVEDLAEGTSSRGRLDAMSHAILSPFTSRKPDSNRLLSDCTWPASWSSLTLLNLNIYLYSGACYYDTQSD